METKARYVLIGLFTLIVAGGVFGFIYWLHNTGGLRERTVYRIRFENTVSGLLTGAAVLFNGIRVGDVTGLKLEPDNPKEVMVTLAIDPGTPVRSDSQVSLEFRGLTGTATVAISGGSAKAPLLKGTPGEPPTLTADPTASQDMTQAVRDVLQHVDTILSQNSDALHSTLTNLDTFSQALARNSVGLDQIVNGLVKMTGGAEPKVPAAVFDLSAPRTFPAPTKPPRGTLVVAEATTLLAFDSQKITLRSPTGEIEHLDNGQWSDSLSRMVQEKIIQSFENAKLIRAVTRPNDAITPEFQLLTDIRKFQVTTAAEPTAEVEFGAKVLGANGKILDGQVFRASAAVKSLDDANAVAALNEAFAKTATDLVIWAASVVER
ncbi:MAG: ABC-type transport auxiliary lipoprotein family protein [Xanthobacteraceae bacterium]